MQAAFTTDEHVLIDGFAAALRALPDHVAAVDGKGPEPGYLVDAFAMLHRDGWLDLRDEDTGLPLPLATLAGLVEGAARQRVPYPLPLLEYWTAAHLLDPLGGVEAALDSAGFGPAATVSLGLGGLFGNAGTHDLVPFGDLVDAVLVVRGDALHLVPAVAAGLVEMNGFCSSIPAHGIPSAHDLVDATRIGTVSGAVLDEARATYLILQAAEMVGAAAWQTETTVEYLKVRKQFGVALASFQALQHKAADMLLAVETCRSLTYYAACRYAEGADTALDLALTAKGYSGTKLSTVGNQAIQLHGGIGFTWEGGIHYDTTRIAFRAATGMSSHDCLATAGLNAIERGSLLR